MTLPVIVPSTRYFIDFDHTISRVDVWDTLVKCSDPDRWREIIDGYVSGRLSSRLCNLELAQAVRLNRDEALKIIADIGIDPTFHDFVSWAQNRNFPLMILSDGYDFYIEYLLKQEGLEHIPYYCNRMVWTETGIQVEFPLYKEDCERDMAHCKCQHVLPVNGARRVYIGDGVSDTCAAAKCDFVYAKHNLLEFCRTQQIQHKPFTHFQDIIENEEKWFLKTVESAITPRA